MQHVKYWLGLAAPLVLLDGAALAQQAPPPHLENEAHQTRELEGEVEEYPGAEGEPRSESEGATSIPERVEPGARGAGRNGATPDSSDQQRGQGRVIDPAEVQRVFGRDTRLIALGGLEPAQLSRLQLRLRELGHYEGPVDGVMGPRTRAAIHGYARAQFRLKERLIQQGQLTTDLAEQLGVMPARGSDGVFEEGVPGGLEEAPADEPSPAIPDQPWLPQPGPADVPPLPPGSAPLPPPGLPPLPTPSSVPPLLPPGNFTTAALRLGP